jgi:hypothetical protein
MKLVQILSEAKKDDVRKELLSQFPEAETYIDAAIRSDSTGYKYMDYIKRSFEDLYPALKSWNRSDNIFDYFDNITWWEKNYNKLTVDDLDAIYEDAKADSVPGSLLSTISSIKPEAIKDINSWDIRMLKYVRDYINQKKSRKEIEKEAKSGAELVYQNPNGTVLVYKINTHAASCFYGANTRWCTTSKTGPGHFQRETQDYVLYYVIDRTRNRGKIAVQVPRSKRGSIITWRDDDQKKDLSYLIDIYPEVEDFFGEMLGKSASIEFLKDYNPDTDPYSWRAEYPDELIYLIRNVKDPETEEVKTIVNVKFDGNNDFWDLFSEDESEYDRAIIDNIMSSFGSTWDFYDRYSMDDEWNEGYIWNYATEEQRERISDLSKKLFPNYMEDLIQNDLEGMSKDFNESIEVAFSSEVSDIIDEYTFALNNRAEASVREYLIDEYCEIFKPYGAETSSCFYAYLFPKEGLIKLLTDYPATDIFNSMKKYVTDKISAPYELQDVGYQQYGDDSEDYFAYFKQMIDNLIDSMETALESDDTDFVKKEEEYDNFMKTLRKFDVYPGRWFPLPVDPNLEFKIRSVDFKEGTVDVIVKSQRTNTTTEHNPTYEEFVTLLVNYQLNI